METGNGPIHYWVEGNGKESLFLIHGMALTHHIFLPQLEYFKNEYKVILMDLPGHGKSRPFKHFSQKESVEYMHRIMQLEKISSSHIAGVSMGGYVAQEFAWKYPEKTKSLALIGSHPLGKQHYWKVEQFLLNRFHHVIPLIPYQLLVSIVVTFSSNQPIGKKLTRFSIMQHSQKEIKKLAQEVYNDFLSFEQELPIEKDIPVGVFMGQWDMVGRLKWVTLRWANEKGFHSSTIKGTAHNVNVDNHYALNHELKSFFDSETNLSLSPDNQWHIFSPAPL